MKMTERGQVTIPKEIREKYGITPATEIEFIEKDGALLVVKKMHTGALDRFRGIANAKGMPRRTDRLLSMLRDSE